MKMSMSMKMSGCREMGVMFKRNGVWELEPCYMPDNYVPTYDIKERERELGKPRRISTKQKFVSVEHEIRIFREERGL